MPDSIMLFAAGFGTRMRPLTLTRPKPLIEVAGKPLIDHALGLAQDAGLGRIVVNAHYKADMLERHLAGTGVPLSVERPEILDTGGGLRKALPFLGEGAVMTLNTDAIWAGSNPLTALQKAWDPARMDALLALVPLERAKGRAAPGDFNLDPKARIGRGGDLVYTGAQILKTDTLATIPDPAFSLNLLWDRFIAEGRCYGLVWEGTWCDVGAPDNIQLAEAVLNV